MFRSVKGTPAFATFASEVARFSGAQWRADGQAPALPDIGRLHALALPVLLLTGGRDMSELHLIADVIAAAAPDVEHHERADLGHLLHLEDPAWCYERLTAFWDAHSR